MRFHVLATDYDGTIAHDGVVDEVTLNALRRAKESGRKLVMVTGRELPELLALFPHVDLFEQIVFENGAAVYDPSTKEVRVLAEPPPPEFAEVLKKRGVFPVSTGHVIVATFQPHQDMVFRVIHESGLALQVIFNKDAVMVLPSGVTKATGLAAALSSMGLSAHNAVGVGDAENDHAFLARCEFAAAVENALPAVKDRVDWVSQGARGAGVTELIEHLIGDDLASLNKLERHYIPVGKTDDGKELGIDPAGGGVMVCGTSGSGKSTLTTGLLERFADAGYQFVIIDPEGDYTNLDFATILGSPARAPLVEEVMNALKDPVKSVVVNLLGVPLADRPAFFGHLLPRILELRTKTGRPHWLVVDETHHILPAERELGEMTTLLPDTGLFGITVHPGSVDPAFLEHIETLLFIGKQPDKTAKEFCEASGATPPQHCPDPAKLPTGDVVIWQRGSEASHIVHTVPPRTERKRHLRKYAEGNLGPERSFYFRGPEEKLNLKAPNLFQFLQLADGVDDATWEHHLRAGDYSRWLREQVKDPELAADVEKAEADAKAKPKESRAAIRAAVEARYTLPTDAASGVSN